MNSMNGWISFPMIESLNHHDFAIRKFCPARLVEQEQGGGGGDSKLWEEEEALFNYEIELWSSPSDHDHTTTITTTTTTTTPHLASFEEEEFVESFFNMDSYENDDKFSILPQDHQKLPFGCFQDDDNDEKFSIIDDVFEEVPLTIDEEMEEIISDDHDQVLEGGVSLEMVPQEEVTVSHDVDQGLHLVHLLLACAEAVGCRDTQLANSMLNQVWESASPWGDSLQRVSYCFAIGLKSRLSHLLHNVNANGTLFINNNGANMDRFFSLINKEEKLEAFQLLYQTTPYIAFGFMAANEAICEAAQGKESLHIINLGMEHALQWPSLIRTLASRPEGPPKLIRITGLIKSTYNHHLNLSSELEDNMKGVIEDAKALGIPLEFNMVSESVFTPELLTTETLNLREGEALFVNSIMHLHKYVKESRGSLKAVLQAIKKLSPTLLTVVEQDSNHNGPFFLGRFLESLHYYSAIFDSLEASLSRSSPQRMKIEGVHFAEEICNIVAYEGTDRIERHERADQWRRQLGRAGFQVVGLKCMSQARMMLSVYGCDGYTLASEKGCLLLGWKGRPIMLASAWQLHH